MTDQEMHTVDILNDLIEVSRDGQYGFERCADRVDSAQLRETLRQRAVECEGAARELQELVIGYGGRAEDSGSMLGAIHRGWVSVRDAISRDADDQAVLEECERGEDSALARYRKALQQPLPDEAARVVQRQLVGVQRHHDQIRALRDAVRM